MDRRSPVALPLALLAVLGGSVLLAGSAARDVAAADDVTVLDGIPFVVRGGDPVLLDLAKPARAGDPLPAVVVIHGGGWSAGSRRMHGDLVRLLARRGYVAATIDYRLAPRNRWPAQLEDCRAAVRWLRAHAAEHGIDAKRIGAMGFSAGGHLSMLLGTTDDVAREGEPSACVQAVVSWFGPTNLAADDLPTVSNGILDVLFGGEGGREDASPIRHVDAKDAPMLLLQGTKDRLVPASQATAMADAMTQAGLEGQVLLLLGQDHGWMGSLLADTLEDSIRFLDRHLKGRRGILPPR